MLLKALLRPSIPQRSGPSTLIIPNNASYLATNYQELQLPENDWENKAMLKHFVGTYDKISCDIPFFAIKELIFPYSDRTFVRGALDFPTDDTVSPYPDGS